MFRIVFTHDDIEDIVCPSLESAKKMVEEYECPCAIMSANDMPIAFYFEPIGFMHRH